MEQVEEWAKARAAEHGWHWWSLGETGYLGRDWWRSVVLREFEGK